MANDMRDRLVELLKTASYYLDEQDVLCNRIADHLIKNGVIVPPCKVGDKIWYITTSYMTKIPKVQSGRVEKIVMTKNGIDLIADNYVSKLTYGKRSFFTKEQAGQKLKEMRGGND